MHKRFFWIVFLFAVASAPAAAYDLNLAVGADFSGDFDASGISVSANTGYTLGLELAPEIDILWTWISG